MKRELAESILDSWKEMSEGPSFDKYVIACPEAHLDEMAKAVKVLAPSQVFPSNLRDHKALADLVASVTVAPAQTPKEIPKEVPKESPKEKPVK